jgi:uncharacterized protein DUF3489
LCESDHFSLAFLVDRSDESNAPERSQKRKTNMNVETTDTGATVAAQGETVASEKTLSKKGVSRKKDAPGAKKMTRATAAKKAASTKAAAKSKPMETAPRAENKGAKILELIGRAKGATLAEIMKAADWQAHSVRGFISTAGKKHNVTIDSSKNEAGDRVYKIAK